MILKPRNSLKTALRLSVAAGAVLFCLNGAYAAVTDGAAAKDEAPIDFSADTLTYNEKEQTVTATGDVEFVQGDRVVKAQKVTYDLTSEIVKGEGEVTIMEPSGDVVFAKDIEFSRDLANGMIKGMRAVLVDGSRFAAEKGRRENGTKIIMEDATYTACEPCKKDPSKAPVWQIHANKVIHDKEEKKISYEDATFDVFGVPVAYTPYFAHPDGTEKRKSGFLPPSISFSSRLGTGVEGLYYYDIAPDLDATFGTRVYSKENPLGLAQIRKRFENAKIELNGGLTNSDRVDSTNNGQRVRIEDEWRGHLFGEGLWNMSDKWRSGFNAELVSDDQYARQYDISNDDVLENTVYAERFSGRDYASIKGIYYQDIRVVDRQTDQPFILPQVESRFIGEPNSLLGGRWDLGVSALELHREANGENTTRFSSDLGWVGRYVLPVGLVNTFQARARGDAYYVDGRELIDSGTEMRFYPYAQWESRMPFARNFNEVQAVIEPKMALTVAPDINNENTTIPNEDSRDVTLDHINLFDPNRFPGYDRVEDNTRITYGVRTGLYDADQNQLEVFLGQSQKLVEDKSLFVDGSGLEDKGSDFVGEIKAQHDRDINLSYRFQFDQDDFTPERHEVDSTVNVGPFSLNTVYLYAKALRGTDIRDKREQVNANLRTRLSENWNVTTGAVYDFAEPYDGARRYQFGVTYLGQCVTISSILQRNFTRDTTGESSTEFFMRLGLKNVAENNDIR
ncbi:MAG: LPS-assembly protein LptD [Pseudobdellovibrionaceae bacterium]